MFVKVPKSNKIISLNFLYDFTKNHWVISLKILFHLPGVIQLSLLPSYMFSLQLIGLYLSPRVIGLYHSPSKWYQHFHQWSENVFWFWNKHRYTIHCYNAPTLPPPCSLGDQDPVGPWLFPESQPDSSMC